MDSQPERKDKRFVDRFDTIIAFVSLELIALVSFGLGGFTGIKLFEIIGFYAGLMTVPFIRLNVSKADLKTNLPVLVPFGCFAILMGFSAFFIKYYGGFGISSLIYCLLETLGLFGFFLLGFGLRSIPVLKKRYVVYAFLGGLALYCLITGIYSLVRYGPFYASVYKGFYYYYQGAIFPIDVEGKGLIGFQFFEVSLKYAGILGVLLASSASGLLFLSPKKHPRQFIALASLAFIGLLYLLLIPYWHALIFVGVAYLFALGYWLVRRLIQGKPRGEKGADIAFKIAFGLLTLLACALILLLLMESKTGWIKALLNGLIGRVPMSVETALLAIEDVIYGAARDASLGHVDVVSLLFGFHNPYFRVHPTRFFEINVLWQNGLIAFLLLVALTLFVVWNSRKYLKEAKDDLNVRMIVCTALLSLFLYMSLFADDFPVIHGNGNVLFTQNNYFLIAMFLIGFSYVPLQRKETNHE